MPTISHWIRNLGLWPRMAMGISAGFLVFFVGISVLGENVLHANTSRLLDERLGFAQMAASQLDGILAQSRNELEQAINLADFDPESQDLSDEVHILSHTFGLVGSFTSGIFFLDNQGQVVLSHPPGLSPLSDTLSDLPYIVQVIESGSVVISEPFREPISNKPVTAINVPILKDGRVVGILSGLLDLEGIAIVAPLEEAARFAQTGHALLVDQNGRVVVSTDQAPFLSPGEHGTFYREAIAQGVPVVKTIPVDQDHDEGEDRPHVMAVAPLGMAPWGVAVGGDADEIFAGVRRLRIGLITMAGIALLATWITTLIGTRFLVRPVQQLTHSAQKIAKGDLDVKLQVHTGGEIEMLAEALDSMRLQLLANIEKLENSKEFLEVRVSERTEALRHQQVLTRQLLKRAISAQEDERSRISQELHDETGQILTAIQINLDRIVRKASDTGKDLIGHLSRVQVLTEQALTSLRGIIADLRPGVLDQLGLVPALGWVAEQTLQPLEIQVNVEAQGLRDRLPGEIETILFRIAQEAISNVARHSRAKNLSISLKQDKSVISMRLTDDGFGFNPLTVASTPEFNRGLGLASMQERASLAGGKVTVESAPRRGTTIHVTIPVSENAKQVIDQVNGNGK